MAESAWFHRPGVKGERSLAEQMQGLEPALEAAKGKRVLDLGCAEGLIALEFSRAGAAHVHGVELYKPFFFAAQDLAAGRNITVERADLNKGTVTGRYEVVLALAILHKLHQPARGLRFVAGLCAELLVIRLPHWFDGRQLVSKNGGASCDLAAVLTECGMVHERTVPGPRAEPVQYWRRRC